MEGMKWREATSIDLTPIFPNDVKRKALFGDGTQAGDIITQVLTGDKSANDYNPYDNMHTVLSALGITNQTSSDHQTHFHIQLQAPNIQPIIEAPQNLLADNTTLNQAAPVASDALIVNAQSLLDQVKTDLNFTQGEVTMFIPDMPNVPPQNVPVMIAQATPAQQGAEKLDATIGVCQLIPTPVVNSGSAEYELGAVGVAATYLDRVNHIKVYQYLQSTTTTETVLQQPKHGRLDADTGLYYPESGFFGKDSVTYLVEIGGHRVKVTFFIQVLGHSVGNENYYQGIGNESYNELCPTPRYWKISTTLNPDGTNTITSVEYQSPIINASASTTNTAALASTLESSILKTLSVDPSLVTLNIANLTGGAVGQDNGSNITLDTNAAGNGWFIDTTPSDNSEFLATSNPNEWVAKAGSAAAGKMDMLSVLLHEYGHALGIDHSTDPHDFMGTTLTVGVHQR